MFMIGLDGKVDMDYNPDFLEIRYKGMNPTRCVVLIEDVENFEEEIIKYVNNQLKHAGFI